MARVHNESQWVRCCICGIAGVFPHFCKRCKAYYCFGHWDDHVCKPPEPKPVVESEPQIELFGRTK